MEHLWAPWRKAYVNDTTPRGEIFSRLAQGTDDEANLVLWRGKSFFAVLNRYPYNLGHTLVVPYRVLATLEELSDDELLESMTAVKQVKAALDSVFHPQGFNLGLNLGIAAGAGIEQHLHWHIVPRWNGDANFMTAAGDVRVHPSDLPTVYRLLREALNGPVSS